MLSVSHNPVISDLTLKGYHDQYLKSRVWRDVATSVGMSGMCLLLLSEAET